MDLFRGRHRDGPRAHEEMLGRADSGDAHQSRSETPPRVCQDACHPKDTKRPLLARRTWGDRGPRGNAR